MRRYSPLLVTLLGLLALHAAPTHVYAAVKPHALFSDNAVLQQGTKVPVWGTADPDEKVTVRIQNQDVSTTTDKDGKWLVQLAPLKAGGPFDMTIQGANTVTIKNILVGEVWVCSGQSNMEWTVQACRSPDLDDAKSAPHNAKLRMFTVKKNPQEKPIADVEGSWKESDPSTVPGFSAVAYFFGRELEDKLKVPVGLIHTSWGGTRAEAWTSRAALKDLGSDYVRMIEAHQAALETKKKLNPNDPSVLYNGMIAPLLPFAVKGTIWYQGESNAGAAHAYGRLFPGMIQNWRDDWKKPDMPFYFVQLAPFFPVKNEPSDSTWAELRESQRQTAHKVPHTGMAVITDLGSEYDVHPTPKKPVGQRLAWLALVGTYGAKNDTAKAPDLVSAKFAEGKAHLMISCKDIVSQELVPTAERTNKDGKSLGFAWRVPDGLQAGSKAEVQGFTIAGKDGKFFAAKAKLDKEHITVWSEQVSEPAAVRYGWAQHPICNVFSTQGIPMTPFRTDDFPLTTQPKK
ncbi:MAG: sialate O-acetylesterase [Planctomycetes bacterium]|nr:sialate O-acetylesterase [Planctomycetota bacterium]